MYRPSLGTRGETRRAAAEAETALVGRVRPWTREHSQPCPLAPHVLVSRWVRAPDPPPSPIRQLDVNAPSSKIENVGLTPQLAEQQNYVVAGISQSELSQSSKRQRLSDNIHTPDLELTVAPAKVEHESELNVLDRAISAPAEPSRTPMEIAEVHLLEQGVNERQDAGYSQVPECLSPLTAGNVSVQFHDRGESNCTSNVPVMTAEKYQRDVKIAVVASPQYPEESLENSGYEKNSELLGDISGLAMQTSSSAVPRSDSQEQSSRDHLPRSSPSSPSIALKEPDREMNSNSAVDSNSFQGSPKSEALNHSSVMHHELGHSDPEVGIVSRTNPANGKLCNAAELVDGTAPEIECNINNSSGDQAMNYSPGHEANAPMQNLGSDMHLSENHTSVTNQIYSTSNADNVNMDSADLHETSSAQVCANSANDTDITQSHTFGAFAEYSHGEDDQALLVPSELDDNQLSHLNFDNDDERGHLAPDGDRIVDQLHTDDSLDRNASPDPPAEMGNPNEARFMINGTAVVQELRTSDQSCHSRNDFVDVNEPLVEEASTLDRGGQVSEGTGPEDKEFRQEDADSTDVPELDVLPDELKGEELGGPFMSPSEEQTSA